MGDIFNIFQLSEPDDGSEVDASGAILWFDLPEWEATSQSPVSFLTEAPPIFVDTISGGGSSAPVFPAPVEYEPGPAGEESNPEILDAGNRLSMGLAPEFDSTSGIILIVGNGDDGTTLMAGDEALNWDFSEVELVDINGIHGSELCDVITGCQGADSLFGLGSSDLLEGCGGDDILSGGCGKDLLTGGEGNDFLKGGRGADVLEGGTGSDELRGQRGNDVLIVDGSDDAVISGGRGEDTLVLDDANVTLHLESGAGSDVHGIEIIDAGGTGANNIVLDTAAVLDLSTQSDTLRILGDADDSVVMVEGDWTFTGKVEIDSLSYDVYQNGTAILQLQDGLQHAGLDANGNGGSASGMDSDGGGDASDDGGNGDGSDAEDPGEGNVIPAIVPASSLDGDNGFQISGEDAYDFSSFSVSGAGDINDDGFADVVIGAIFADANGMQSGASYVVFGKAGGFPSNVQLSGLDGSDGFQITGRMAAYTGYSVSEAGDMNGDGIDDLIIGASIEDGGGHRSGAAYIVFGDADGFSSELQLTDLDGTNGFRMIGVSAFDYAGNSVSAAGDVNGDGFADVIIGAVCAADGGYQSGACYVVFGTDAGFASELALADLNGSNGFRIDGEDAFDRIGQSVSGAGDVNGDGYDDFIIGTRAAELDDGYTGAAYVVFGKGSGFGSELQLSGLDGSNGFMLVGSGWGRFGDSVGGAGDVNGDGFDDMVVGAPWANSENGGMSGVSYVIFGHADAFAATVSASSLDGENGFRISGNAGDLAGMEVGGAGDVNADGFDDLIIGAWLANNETVAGGGYVVYGQGAGFAPNINASSLDGSNGFSIMGAYLERLGWTASAAGDVDGDGYDDVIIGSDTADPNGYSSGVSYVIFGGDSNGTTGGNGGGGDSQNNGNGEDGSGDGGGQDGAGTGGGEDSSGNEGGGEDSDDGGGGDGDGDGSGEEDPGDGIVIPAIMPVSSLDGNNGFQIAGDNEWDFSATSVSSAGDINGDGFADIIVGAVGADTDGTHGGGSYIIFGDSGGFPAIVQPSSLDGNNGFQAIGPQSAYAGNSVSAAGDINGDGIDDLIIGSDFEYNGGNRIGATYIVFGNRNGFPAELHLASLDGTDGFRISGVLAADFFGYSVSAAGDINGDGFDDVIIGAVCAATGGYQSGACYVVFGRGAGFAPELAVSTLNGSNGFRIDGEDPLDRIGQAVSGLGDVNGDGYDDFIIGSRAAELEDGYSGAAYIVFGKGSGFGSELQLSALDGDNGFMLVGSGYQRLGDAVGGAGDINGDGFDDIIVGAPRTTAENGGHSGVSYVIFGRADAFAASMMASSLNGEDGFRLTGFAGEWSGGALDGAGDVNADGYADLIIGTANAYQSEGFLGGAYVVYGQATGFAADYSLPTLDGSYGFQIMGNTVGDHLGLTVSAAGDVNDDGFDDVIIGSQWADSNGINSGAAYVIFGGISESETAGNLLYNPESAAFVLDGDDPGLGIL